MVFRCAHTGSVTHLWERWGAASPTNVILFVGDHPTSLSASSVCQVVCESTLIIQLHSRMLDKNEILHLLERLGAAYPTNIIPFVGDPPTSLSASSVCQVVCESTLIIQLHSRMLDKKRSITFVGAMGCSLSHKCYSITFVGSITFVVVTPARSYILVL